LSKRRSANARRPKSRVAKTAAPPRRPNLLAGEDLPPTAKQKRSQSKRAALLKAALALFGKLGFEATSIDQIADSAEVAVGGFYQHFRSKRQILLVLMDELLSKLDQLNLQPRGTDLRAGIREVLRDGLATDLVYAGAYRAWREASLSDSDLARKDLRIRAWTTGRVAQLFEQMRALPNVRRDLALPVFAEILDNLFWQLIGQPPTRVEEMIETLAHVIHHSLFID
jgi:AcrR family transcriptional regulator